MKILPPLVVIAIVFFSWRLRPEGQALEAESASSARSTVAGT